MQVHAFGAKHAFIYRVCFITFYMQLALPVFIYYYPAAYAAVTAGGFE
jgi:hypothetical protein